MTISVFCASSNQLEEVYFNAAAQLGRQLAERGWKLLYGGTNCGLMGRVAETALQHGGVVKGIIPKCIAERGVAASSISELHVVEDMKERKHLLREQADAFIALPGGWGTLEEITEVITLKQLGEHAKPIVFLNVNGFYDDFFRFIRQSQREGFISKAYDNLYQVIPTVAEAMDYIERYRMENVVSKY